MAVLNSSAANLGWLVGMHSHPVFYSPESTFSWKIPQKVQFEDVIPTLLKVFEYKTAKTCQYFWVC